MKEKILNFVKSTLRKKKFWLVFVIIIIGIFIYRYFSNRGKDQIVTTEIKRGDVKEELVLTGSVKAEEYVQLTFPTSGQITWVGVKEGDGVKKGQALTKLDTTTLNSAFQQAKANLRAAEATVQYVHDQVKDHSGDETYAQKDTRTTAEAAKDSAYEAYVAAEYNLRNATIFSPFNGVVTYLAHSFPQSNIIYTQVEVEVINPATIYFDVSADQSEVIDLKVGQKVNVLLDSYPDEEIAGEIAFISYSPRSGETGAVYRVKVIVGKDNQILSKLRIGMTGDAKFVLSEKDDVLYIPPKFVNSDTKGKYVKKGKKNNKIYIEVGIEGEDRIEVSGNLKEGDIIYD